MALNRASLRNTLQGSLGESLAAEFLQSNGFEIIDHNVRSRAGEIDIIATKDETFHFIEVKLRSSSRFGTAAEAVTDRKQKRIEQLAADYLAARNLASTAWQVAVIAIEVDRHGSLKHIELISCEN